MSVDQLLSLDRVLIHQKVEGFLTRNRYQVLNAEGGLLLSAKQRGWPSHSTYLEDAAGNQVIKLRRQPRCFGYPTVEVYMLGSLVAYLQRDSGLTTLILRVLDATKQRVLRVKGPVDGELFSFKKTYEIQNVNKQRVGVIVKESRGFLVEAFLDRDHYRVEFPRDLDVRYKVAAICATIYIDYIREETTD